MLVKLLMQFQPVRDLLTRRLELRRVSHVVPRRKRFRHRSCEAIILGRRLGVRDAEVLRQSLRTPESYLDFVSRI